MEGFARQLRGALTRGFVDGRYRVTLRVGLRAPEAEAQATAA